MMDKQTVQPKEKRNWWKWVGITLLVLVIMGGVRMCVIGSNSLSQDTAPIEAPARPVFPDFPSNN